jgi:hypothetical protein
MSIGFGQTSLETIELPNQIPQGMPYAVDDCSTAFHLGFRNKILWFILMDTTAQYEVVKIPKKKGGVRIIHAPLPMMKLFLRRVHVKYLIPMQDKLGPHVTAYRKGLSARDAVVQHIPKCPICDTAPKGETPKKHECPKRGLFIKMDLKDFFPSTSKAWIRHYFRSIGYSHTVADILAGLLTVADIPNPKYKKQKVRDPSAKEFFSGTPQGSPASGTICNLVANHRLDGPLRAYLDNLNKEQKLEEEWRWRYTRYSDDLSITCGKNPSLEEREEVIDNIKEIIRKSGYKLNGKKTRVSHSYHRKSLLGMVINEKPNYSKEEYLKLRAITHNCLVHGFESQFKRANQFSADGMVTWLRGKINWVGQINPDKGEKLLNEFEMAVALHERSDDDGISE